MGSTHIGQPVDQRLKPFLKDKAMVIAGLPHLTSHGLHRLFGSLVEWREVPGGVVAQTQGHKPSALAEKHYCRRPLDLPRMWHERIETWMLNEGGIEFEPTEQSLQSPAAVAEASWVSKEVQLFASSQLWYRACARLFSA